MTAPHANNIVRVPIQRIREGWSLRKCVDIPWKYRRNAPVRHANVDVRQTIQATLTSLACRADQMLSQIRVGRGIPRTGGPVRDPAVPAAGSADGRRRVTDDTTSDRDLGPPAATTPLVPTAPAPATPLAPPAAAPSSAREEEVQQQQRRALKFKFIEQQEINHRIRSQREFWTS